MARLLPSCVITSLCVLLGMCGLLQIAHAAETVPEQSAADTGVGPASAPWVVYDGSNGPGKGKHVVLVSGDEEYRSEEALPQLGKILATHHGFKCTVLFAIDPEHGTIDPDNTRNIPGLEALRSADLMIIATRFRDLPDEQMKYVAEYVDAGKPVIGMRAAVVAFRLTSPTYERFSSRSRTWKGGFGRQILGQTWMSHHGRHGRESTRGLIAPGAEDHPIVRGCDDVWGPTDVYEVRDTLPSDSNVLMLGQVLEGMQPTDKPLEGPKNDPMMPMAWTRSYRGVNGTVGRVFTTTMGAATDLESEGFRRLLVNAAYWCVGLEEKIPVKANVGTVGQYKPTPFGFSKYKKGMRPSDHAFDVSAAGSLTLAEKPFNYFANDWNVVGLKDYRAAIDVAWKHTGLEHFPPSWERRGTHWGNTETLWPTELFPRDDPRVDALIRHVRHDFAGGFIEGTIQWKGTGNVEAIHPYMGAYTIMADLVRGRHEQVVEDFYWYLLHTTAAHAFPEGIYYKNRMAWNHTIPHVTGACNYALLLRHMLVHEAGDELHLLSAVPDLWLAAGEEIRVESAPTHFGKMGMVVRGTDNGVDVRLDRPMRNPPERIVLHLPESRPPAGSLEGVDVVLRSNQQQRWDFPTVVSHYEKSKAD